jgi:hypothetical protein
MDPSLGKSSSRVIIIADGFKCLYDREVPFELRIHDGEGGP